MLLFETLLQSEQIFATSFECSPITVDLIFDLFIQKIDLLYLLILPFK